jgi:hypothetical protein
MKSEERKKRRRKERVRKGTRMIGEGRKGHTSFHFASPDSFATLAKLTFYPTNIDKSV